MDSPGKKYIFGAGIIVVLCTIAVMLGMTIKQDELIRLQVYQSADTLYHMVVIVRRWVSQYGGVYIKKMPGVETSPYLKNTDITDVQGNVYVFRNPALVTRELSEMSNRGPDAFQFRLTSLKPLNPLNTPDEWESRALKSFEQGASEATRIENTEGKFFYRLMQPLIVEDSCMACHAHQGYKTGEIRGAISVVLPYTSKLYELKHNLFLMGILSLILIVVFVTTIYVFIWRLFDRLSQQNQELKSLNDTKNRFLGMAAHDLRNPLTIIIGNANLLEYPMTDEEKKQSISCIATAAERMLALINDLLDVAKIQAGNLVLSESKISVREFLGKCCDLNKMLGAKKNINLKLDISEDPGSFSLDRRYMAQVMDNLIGNAFKFSPEGTTVTIGTRRVGRDLEIWVEDQGLGIKAEELPFIFDEFKKSSTRPTGGESSHGLGLAIVKKVVEQHHGRIEVTSEVGRGSRFIITLPASE